ncbi:hypothetical protein BDW66DRAFT_148688 [Aspergillus desertorum]
MNLSDYCQPPLAFESAGAGFNWADVEALGHRGIWYANGAGASEEAVSDATLYMILWVFRNFSRAQLAARTADTEILTASRKLIATISHNPRGHILGLVGLGNIRKKVAAKAQALGMSHASTLSSTLQRTFSRPWEPRGAH